MREKTAAITRYASISARSTDTADTTKTANIHRRFESTQNDEQTSL